MNKKNLNKIQLQNVVWKEGKQYVAWNLNTAVSSFGDTKKEAIAMLHEALELHFEDISPNKVGEVIEPNLSSFALEYA